MLFVDNFKLEFKYFLICCLRCCLKYKMVFVKILIVIIVFLFMLERIKFVERFCKINFDNKINIEWI